MMPLYPMVPAANYTPANRADSEVKLIVIHTMESAEKPGTALAVADWFAGKTGTPPGASAHFCVDQWEVIQCVRIADVAWHAPGANRTGIGIELAGRASQSDTEWEDAASRGTLAQAAQLCAELVKHYGIPIRRLAPAQIRGGLLGFCGHCDVTKAYPEKGSGHTDPGPRFPWGSFLLTVSQLVGQRET